MTDARKWKIRHWVATNGSGMNHVAEQMAQAERYYDQDSKIVDIGKPDTWEEALDADIQVCHTDFPEAARLKAKPHKSVFVVHGTPEVVFESTIERFAYPGYAPSDGWQLLKHWIRHADATVTFWERHASFYRSMLPQRVAEQMVRVVPLGVDKGFWAGGTSHGAYQGQPSVWMSENQARIKWALDTIIAWPMVTQELPNACLHAHYIPTGLHRFFLDLANSNDCAFKAHLSSSTYTHAQLRDIWKDVEFLWSPVRYGDHNNLFMQAAASGIQTISYAGNPYADFWIHEGDQREMARQLVPILRHDVEPRADKLPVPDLTDMGMAMLCVYESLYD